MRISNRWLLLQMERNLGSENKDTPVLYLLDLVTSLIPQTQVVVTNLQKITEVYPKYLLIGDNVVRIMRY